jgi:hypothetical protein
MPFLYTRVLFSIDSLTLVNLYILHNVRDEDHLVQVLKKTV